MKTKAHTVTRTTRPPRPAVPVRRPHPQMVRPASVLSPTLTVGAVNDPAEREAETMAARVVGASAPVAAAAPVAAPAGAAQAAAAPLRRGADDQPNLDELTPAPAPADQQDFDLPAANDVPTDGLDAADMAELEAGEPATGGEIQASAGPAAVVGRMGGAAPADVARIVANPGPGRPLPSGVRARVEPHFGTSFEDVRLHDGPADQDAAARIGARAFAHKNHIWLGRGESPTNTRLMAHELTHVVQQTEGAEALPLRREPVRRDEDAPEAGGWGSGAIERLARYVPGYTLITVIMGRTLFSGERVLKTATNLLGGLFGLHPLGTVLFDKLRETRMVEEAFDWVQSRLGELNLTWSRLRGVIDRVFSPPLVGAQQYVIDQFAPLIRDIGTFVVDVGKKVLEFAVRGALRLAGPLADRIWGILQQAGDVLSLIAENPLQFALNLVRAVVGGFRKFGLNILEHLKKGLLGWLFGALAGAGLTLPARFDFKGIMSLVMQVLGLTYANFRTLLVRRLGPRGERMVSMIETSVEIVKILLREGFAGIWQKMLEMMENFKATVIGGISQMVIGTIVEAGIGWLAGLSNPIGAVVRVVKAIYDMIKTFLERLEQIMAVAESIFSSIGAIARGQVEGAANYIEQVIGRSVPVVISFLAALLGLGGISGRIRNVINAIQRPILNAMDRVITFVIKKAKQLFSRIIARLNSRRRLPRKAFRIGTASHEIYGKRVGNRIETMISSDTEGTPEQHKAATDEKTSDLANTESADTANAVETTAGDADQETNAVERTLRPDNATENTRRGYAELQAEYDEAAAEFEALGPRIVGDDNLSEEVEGLGLVRSAPDRRILDIEGEQGSYAEVAATKERVLGSEPREIKNKYELDHVIEKQYAINILNNLNELSVAGTGGQPNAIFRAAPRTPAGNRQAVNTPAGAAPFGQLGGPSLQRISPEGDVLPVIAIYKPNHVRVTGGAAASARGLIRDALATDNPRAYVARALETQVELEINSARDMINGDTTAPAAVKQKVQAGLNSLILDNFNLYGLQSVSTRRPAGHTPPANDTTMPIDGGGRAPNFAQLEGTGRYYRSALSGIAGYLENDHILDDSLPRGASTLPLLNADQLAQVRALVGDHATSAAAQRRLAYLGSSPRLFQPGTGLGDYDSGAGYTVALFKTLADRVTAALPAQAAATVQSEAPSRALVKFAEYVRAPDDAAASAAFSEGVRIIHGHFAGQFDRRVEVHGREILSQYDRSLPEITAANPQNEQAAARALGAIKGRASAAISQSRTVNPTFFPQPQAPAVT